PFSSKNVSGFPGSIPLRFRRPFPTGLCSGTKLMRSSLSLTRMKRTPQKQKLHTPSNTMMGSRSRIPAAVTRPPPKHFELKTRGLGGSGSPLGYPAIRGGSFDGLPLPTHHFLDPDRSEG